MVTLEYKVTGMSCEHCVNAVTGELSTVPGVTSVTVDLVTEGISLVIVTADRPLPATEVRDALDAAGGYQLADR